MKLLHTIIFAVLIFISAALRAEQSHNIVAVGSYSNFQYTEEHQYGSGVQLWRDGSTMLGIFSHSAGLIGDTPLGRIENTEFDSKTGHISFNAKLTMGLHSCKIHKEIPGRDMFIFDGILSKKSISGILKHADSLHPESAPIEEKVTFVTDENWGIQDYPNKPQWDASVNNILKYRGPKR